MDSCVCFVVIVVVASAAVKVFCLPAGSDDG